MRYAKKNKGKIVEAYELGAGTEMEKRLIAEGVIQVDEDGTYRLFSKEAVNGTGQAAKAGDFFKVNKEDEKIFAYPNERKWFLENHRYLGDNEFEQVCKPLLIWMKDDPPCEEIRFLLRTERLRIDSGNKEKYYNAELWGTMLSAPDDAVILFYNVIRDKDGQIRDISYNFVDKEIFERDYTVCADQSG